MWTSLFTSCIAPLNIGFKARSWDQEKLVCAPGALIDRLEIAVGLCVLYP